MKELEKTKRISISAVLFLLVIVIAILTFEKPKHIFEKNTQATLQEIVNKSYILTLNELDSIGSLQYQLIDIRSDFEYSKGHIKDAVNVSTQNMLEEDHKSLFDELREKNKIAVLYGKDPDEANSAWMLLYQLGYENAKILCVKTNYIDNIFQVKNYALEKHSVDFAQVMQLAKSNADKTKESITKPKVTKKVVITVPKKKKRAPEGGC
ncbi:MAG: rhodanese-like domain-containing protein [Aureibaculum sp.]|nr:rhodanese-like domain-containing protein [Aureibaculum sp.]